MTDSAGNYCRRSARVVLLDGSGRVLLLRFHDDPERPSAGHLWLTPGGGVRDGESLAVAAARELHEETGLRVAPGALGPVVARTSGYADLGWAEGVFLDVFFHHRVPDGLRIDTSGHDVRERAHFAGHRWWTRADLAATAERVVPLGLPALLTGLAAGHTPASPVELPWHH
ncbi:NUDIX hydrolase [Streptomyces sp. NPDC050400]|uniref:NUDIX hydrolase n=1 Tax=Streptomyces sp. NPDC050400 TaxID=3365610 RepID=UPI0037A3EB54